MPKTVLILDDDPTHARVLRRALEREGFAVRHASDMGTGLDLASAGGAGIDAVLADPDLDGAEGLEVLDRLAEIRPELPVIVLSSVSGVDIIVRSMRAGAVNFLVKPASTDRVMQALRSAFQLDAARRALTEAGKGAETAGPDAAGKAGGAGPALSFDTLIANDPAMKTVVRMAERAAASDIPVLLLGESGAGKEVIASCIRNGSARADRPFVTVNCGAIPETLVESILFGHEKGAFTGAVARSPGKFAEADGGTLFLDEVGELPLDMQVKLLRVLQEGEVDPVGARRPVKVNVRIISATNRDLAARVAEGAFREDLFYRLNVFPVDVPALRERPGDIEALARHFIGRFNRSEGTSVEGLAPGAAELLAAHDWPGNVRELENSLFRAVILADSPLLGPADFPQLSGLSPTLETLAADPSGQGEAADAGPRADKAGNATGTGHAPSPLPRPANDVPQSHSALELFDPDGDMRSLLEVEQEVIERAVAHYGGRMSEISRKLGIGRSTLYRKVRDYDIEVRGAG